ncbi:hypothetical protein DESPIG_02812 [Desulfovibrio piger ATCC 29098]|uniref:Uncharacterized protein n=1 Tax=Desulfovibrio piger ATCC 29098 TaxID=411464 RepID=B6WXI6_9BACT|nr:hypothetical protein DESPIG_02812 [Desulfovibrio piger ATCC 29098]
MLSRQAQSSAQRSRRRQQSFRQQGQAPVTGGAFFFRQLLAVPAAAGPGHGQQPGQGDLFAAVHAQAAAAAAQIAQQAFQGADARRAQMGVAPGQQLRHLVTGVVRLVTMPVGQGESGAQAGQVPPFLFQFALQGMLGVVHGQDLRGDDFPAGYTGPRPGAWRSDDAWRSLL